MEYPCPGCKQTFPNIEELYHHAYAEHYTGKEEIMRKITKEDFTQVDSHWVCIVDGLHLSLKPDSNGEFKLLVMGELEPIPAATTSPTDPEWEEALRITNYLAPLTQLAKRRED